jgi:hypothetical protein
MSFLSLRPTPGIPSIETTSANDLIVATRCADRLKSRLAEMQEELKHDEQLEVVAFLPSGAAVRVDSVGYQKPALPILKGQDQATGKDCVILVHQSSMQILVSIKKVPPGETQRMILFHNTQQQVRADSGT